MELTALPRKDARNVRHNSFLKPALMDWFAATLQAKAHLVVCSCQAYQRIGMAYTSASSDRGRGVAAVDPLVQLY